MIGAISGDVIGSVHEGASPKCKDFPLFVAGSTFTDDTVLTIAVASAIMSGMDYASSLRRWGRQYPHAGYGGWCSEVVAFSKRFNIPLANLLDIGNYQR